MLTPPQYGSGTTKFEIGHTIPLAGTCIGVAGAEVELVENLDYNCILLWSGRMGNVPMTIVDGQCELVYLHSSFQVNIVFEVVGSADLQTAYVGKHPS
ncbi:hypothetical protein LTR93_011249 [Exophiala xenobiotica]|nr:hypothetical protein LTR93_011249 [Exophiala xenobiotica]